MGTEQPLPLGQVGKLRHRWGSAGEGVMGAFACDAGGERISPMLMAGLGWDTQPPALMLLRVTSVCLRSIPLHQTRPFAAAPSPCSTASLPHLTQPPALDPSLRTSSVLRLRLLPFAPAPSCSRGSVLVPWIRPDALDPSWCCGSILQPWIHPAALDPSCSCGSILLLWIHTAAVDPSPSIGSSPRPGLPLSSHPTGRALGTSWGGSVPFPPTSPSHSTPLRPLIHASSWGRSHAGAPGELCGQWAAGGGSQFGPIALLGLSIPGGPRSRSPSLSSLPFSPHPSPPRQSCQSTGQTGTSWERESAFCKRLFSSIKIHQPEKAAAGGRMGKPIGFHGGCCRPPLRRCIYFTPPPFPTPTFHVNPVTKLGNKYQRAGKR